ncbi:MAG: rubredoxin [Methanobrevibacter sp.]|uniref:rubredoxin n=1 Tax=Methanobrevibacter sp. TaxID=66852 RepID=UPI0026DF4247|nr:rubredoxin [Methanobrevibacter sp.]MDO5849160.1 rubredoxin [Methanobrevibacter sp.]
MQKWRCKKCGYVYDPEEGAPGFKIGTAFEDLPDSFKCPTCGATKPFFRKMRD